MQPGEGMHPMHHHAAADAVTVGSSYGSSSVLSDLLDSTETTTSNWTTTWSDMPPVSKPKFTKKCKQVSFNDVPCLKLFKGFSDDTACTMAC